MSTTIELREKRAGLVKQARELMDAAKKREGGIKAEDRQEFDRLMNAADEVRDEFSRIERLEAAEREIELPGPRLTYPVRDVNEGPLDDEEITPGKKFLGSRKYRGVYRRWLTGGDAWQFTQTVPAEYRDTILGTDAKGGFFVTPTALANEIVKMCDDLVYIRQLSTVVTMPEAKAFGIPQLSARMADANWTTEVQAVTEDTTLALTRRDLTPYPLTKLSKVSIRMLYANSQIETFLKTELGYKFAITEEKAYLTGSGTAQPLGIFTASASGIPTGRDVSTGNTATAITADNLLHVKYSLKAPYRADPTTRWVFHRDAVKSIMLLKDTQNRYLWESSLQANQPDRLLSIPVLESEYAPNTFTTGLYVGALGAFRYYWIAQVDELSIQRLVELYAATNEVGFIGRRFLDAAPALGEAFARVKLA